MEIENIKQVIAVRKDLEMSVGKIAVQVSHASVDTVLKALRKPNPWGSWLDKWINSGMKKIVVQVSNERELYEVYTRCLDLDIPCSLIRDAGRTELEPGTPTAVGLGPAPSRIIDKVTGNLPLYK